MHHVKRAQLHDGQVLLGVLLQHVGGGLAHGHQHGRAPRGATFACTPRKIWNRRRALYATVSKFSGAATSFYHGHRARRAAGMVDPQNRHIFDLGIATKKGKVELISDPGRVINVQ